MPTFDVVSRLDLQEIDNAVSNVLREIKTRYDFKGSETTDRKSVVQGKSVDLGGRRIIKKKKQNQNNKFK